jgi:hypothetical protein
MSVSTRVRPHLFSFSIADSRSGRAERNRMIDEMCYFRAVQLDSNINLRNGSRNNRPRGFRYFCLAGPRFNLQFGKALIAPFRSVGTTWEAEHVELGY